MSYDRTENKKKLFRAAIHLFATEDYNAVSIRRIEFAARIDSANIYHYYGSKEDLLVAILEQISTELLETLNNISKQDLDPLDQFKLLLQAHLKIIAERKKEAELFILDKIVTPKGRKTLGQVWQTKGMAEMVPFLVLKGDC